MLGLHKNSCTASQTFHQRELSFFAIAAATPPLSHSLVTLDPLLLVEKSRGWSCSAWHGRGGPCRRHRRHPRRRSTPSSLSLSLSLTLFISAARQHGRCGRAWTHIRSCSPLRASVSPFGSALLLVRLRCSTRRRPTLASSACACSQAP